VRNRTETRCHGVAETIAPSGVTGILQGRGTRQEGRMEVVRAEMDWNSQVTEPRLHTLRLGDQSASGDDLEEEQN
jgi:hypothetical protein